MEINLEQILFFAALASYALISFFKQKKQNKLLSNIFSRLEDLEVRNAEVKLLGAKMTQIREDLDLVSKNPQAARRKIKKAQ